MSDPKKGVRHLHQKPEVIYAFIFQHHNEFLVVKMCQVFGVSRSGYYDWLKRAKSKQKERKEQLTQQIRNEYLKSRKIYGSPKITQELRKQGIRVSQKTVARIMSEEGLRSITVRKFKATTNSNHPYNVYANLLKQNFQATAPNEIWMADITYIPTDEGWLYLASIMDLYTRKIVGWYIDTRMTKELVIKALQRALNSEKPTGRVIHHSDRGSQYASNDYQQLLQEHHFQVSMSRRGNCYDNACMESFHSLIKKECIYLNRFRTRKEAKQAIFEYQSYLCPIHRDRPDRQYLSSSFPIQKGYT
ncbi:IS3 family transposase [Aeribacillus sp. FSL K6-1121]|uniref:IS3 family transposase n=3 Tax=Aeribacillus TaxID=1055323 RepID=UPI0030F51BC7